MEEQNTQSRKYWIILSILALLLLVLLFWLFIQRSQLMKLVKEKEVEKAEMQHNLDSLMTEHNNLKVSYGALSDSLKSKDSLIQVNALEIKKLLDNQWDYNTIHKKFNLGNTSISISGGSS